MHEGSSVGFYILIALILGVITYVEFALVEYKDTWFAALSGPLILALLIGLSVVKFIMVVMFFMHLKGDDRTFTGFFSSGMVIAVGTLFALSLLKALLPFQAARRFFDPWLNVPGLPRYKVDWTSTALEDGGYRTHEFGDSMLVFADA